MNEQLSLLPNIDITSRSLTLPTDFTLDLWEEVGCKISILAEAGPFIIGDWLNAAAKKHGVTIAGYLKSESAKKMPGISGFSYDSLNSFASVMEKIPPDYRIKGVSFAHHQAVCRIAPHADDSDEKKRESWDMMQQWLMVARDKELNIRELSYAVSGRISLDDLKSGKDANLVPQSSTAQLALKYTITDVALTSHRSLRSLVEMFDTEEPVESWQPERRQSALLALEPVMDDLTKLTDTYIALRRAS